MEMALPKRSSISATTRTVPRCMGRPPTFVLIFGGTLENGLSCATGSIVVNALHAPMSSNVISELIQERSDSCVRSVQSASCEATI